MGWVERIGELYRLNDARLKVRADAVAFATADGALRAGVTAFGASGELELEAPDLHPARRKVLESLGNHWTGLTVFVEHPEVPMDNNTAERSRTRAGGGSEELLRQWVGVERPTGGDDVLAVPDALPVGPEPSPVVDGLPGSVCRSRRPGGRRCGPVHAMEPQPGAKTGVGM